MAVLHSATGDPSNAEPFGARAERVAGKPMLFFATLITFTFFCIPRSMNDPDIWWHLRNAQQLLSTGRFIGADLYSFTAHGARWMNHEWLAELPFYFGWTLGGERGLYLVTVAVVELLLLGIFLLAWRRSRSLIRALLVSAIAALLCTVTFGPRTVLFGWLWLVVELLILDLAHEWPSIVRALPVLFLLWINTHGSWLIGMVLLVAYMLCERLRFNSRDLVADGLCLDLRRQLTVASALCLPILFINPYGWRLVVYPFNLAFRQRLNIANVQEWQSLDLHSPRGLIFLGTLALVCVSQLCRRRIWSPYELACLFLGIYSALVYTRFLALFSIVALPLLAASVPYSDASTPAPPSPAKPLLNAALLFFLLCLVIGRVRSPDFKDPAQRGDAIYPAGAIPVLAALHPSGRVFNEYRWGGYMIWNLRDTPVFIDSRVDLFEYNGTFKDYLDIIHIKDSLALLKKYDIRYVFFERDTPLVYLLEHTGGWTIDYEQGTVIVLERVGSEPLRPTAATGAQAEHPATSD